MKYYFNNESEKYKSEALEAINIIKDVLGDWDVKITFTSSNGFKTYGYCREVVSQKQYIIALSNHLVNKEDKINTLIHELLHSRNFNDGHKGMWKKEAEKISRTTKYDITRVGHKDVDDGGKEYKEKYSLYCTCCGKYLGGRQKRSNVITHSNNFRSGCCGSKIKIVENF